MSKLIRKASRQPVEVPGKYERFNLLENPFPSEPAVNQESTDKRVNGNIFETEIRRNELGLIEENFLKADQSSPNHLRLGYIIDTSYIGRGNGKSAFLVNLQNYVNREYCLDISEGSNKTFAVYMTPKPGGRTKTFQAFVDSIWNAILRSGIIEATLASLRIEALIQLGANQELLEGLSDEEAVRAMGDISWFNAHNVSPKDVHAHVKSHPGLQELPAEFPIFLGTHSFYNDPRLVTEGDFSKHYEALKSVSEKVDFVFSHLVKFFQSAGFTGCLVLVDDFERVPEFQSARQQKDFALELRSVIFDGPYVSARSGFYMMFLVLHAGVPRLLADAWAGSGIENRAPMNPSTYARHIIPFEKLSQEHARLLLQKYLEEYRHHHASDPLAPFDESAVTEIGEKAEYNAAKILKAAYDLLERATLDPDVKNIDATFVKNNRGVQDYEADAVPPSIDAAASTDLLAKAKDHDE